MKKILIYENVGDRNAFIQSVDMGMKSANNLAQTFNALPLANIMGVGDITLMLSDIHALILDKLPRETVNKLFGVPIKPKKAVELLELDTDALTKELSTVNRRDVFAFLQVAKFNGKSFVVDETKMNERLEQFKIYATTEKEIQAAKALLELKQVASTLIQLSGSYRPDYWLKFNFYNKTVEINPSAWQNISR